MDTQPKFDSDHDLSSSCEPKSQAEPDEAISKHLPYDSSTIVEENIEILKCDAELANNDDLDSKIVDAKEEIEQVHSLEQRFDSSATAYQVLNGVDLTGKYALITGSNAGIGYETAKSLAHHGCNVLFANRNLDCTQQAIKDIARETNALEKNMKFIHLDLASLKSVRECAFAVKTIFSDHLDILVLNAGIFGIPYTETEDGYESHCQVNHLSHLYLTLLLEPLLKRGSRVIFVSSESHRMANLKNIFKYQNIATSRDDYSPVVAYSNSKLYNIITAKILCEEWRNKGILVNSVHPGSKVYSNLSKSWWFYRLAFAIARPFTKSLQQAAATTVYVATAPELEGVTGHYFNNCFYFEESAASEDKELNNKVFAISLNMITARMGMEYLQSYLNKYPHGDKLKI